MFRSGRADLGPITNGKGDGLKPAYQSELGLWIKQTVKHHRFAARPMLDRACIPVQQFALADKSRFNSHTV